MRTFRTVLVLSVVLCVVGLSPPLAHAVEAAPTGGLPDLTWHSIGWTTKNTFQRPVQDEGQRGSRQHGRGTADDFWVAMFYANQMAFKSHVSGLRVGGEHALTFSGVVVVEPGHYLTETYID
jgi:hypothetical protein